MNSLISGLTGNNPVIPPAKVTQDFESRFVDALNIEWTLRDDYYEAIFYCEAREHIACYSKTGGIINHKINISPPVLPDKIRSTIDSRHEVMNVVEIYSASGIVSYEIIARDNNLMRFLFNIDSEGIVISKHSL